MSPSRRNKGGRIPRSWKSLIAAPLVVTSGLVDAEPVSRLENEISSENGHTIPSGTESSIPIDSIGSNSLQPFAEFTRFSTDFDRSLAFDEALLLADSKQLTRLLSESSTIKPNSMQVALQEAVFRRFAMLDPVQALELAGNVSKRQQRRMQTAIFQEWSSVNLDAVIDYLVAQRPTPLRTYAFEAIVEIRDDLSDDAKTSYAQAIGLEEFIAESDIYLDKWKNLEDMESIWLETMASGSFFSSPMIMLLQLGEKWIDDEGLGALAKVSALTDDWRLRRTVLRRLIYYASTIDPQAIFEYTLKMFGDTDWPLVEEAARIWVTRNPELAISAISEFETNRLNQELLSVAIMEWARIEPRIVLKKLEGLPAELRRDAQLSALSNVSDYSKKEVTQLVEGFDTKDKHRATNAILESWRDYAFDDAFDWVLSTSRPSRREPEGLATVLEDMSSLDAEIAVEKALKHPLDQNEIGLEADVLAYFAISNLDGAKEKLSLARNSKTRLEAVAKIGFRLMRQEDPDQAIEMAVEIPIAARKTYFKRVVPAWFSVSLGNPIEYIENLPHSDMQSPGALLVSIYGLTTSMSEPQQSNLRHYMNREDLERIDRVKDLLTQD